MIMAYLKILSSSLLGEGGEGAEENHKKNLSESTCILPYIWVEYYLKSSLEYYNYSRLLSKSVIACNFSQYIFETSHIIRSQICYSQKHYKMAALIW
jgi:hypothetical protein